MFIACRGGVPVVVPVPVHDTVYCRKHDMSVVRGTGIYIIVGSRTESWFHIKSACRVCRFEDRYDWDFTFPPLTLPLPLYPPPWRICSCVWVSDSQSSSSASGRKRPAFANASAASFGWLLLWAFTFSTTNVWPWCLLTRTIARIYLIIPLFLTGVLAVVTQPFLIQSFDHVVIA